MTAGEYIEMQDDKFELGGRVFRSRLIVGTGKYRDFEETKKAVEASGAEIVTVAVRRVNITDRNRENLLDFLDPRALHDSAQHGGLLHRRRGDSHLAAWRARPASATS